MLTLHCVVFHMLLSLNQIEQQANPKLIDGFMLDYLLTMIARQNLMTEEEATDKLLDSTYNFISTIFIIHKYTTVTRS